MQIKLVRSRAIGLGMLAATALSVSVGQPAFAQQAPIVQPGAPGENSRALTREQSLELGQSSYIEADARFMQHMIVHHGQAVDMGALVEGRSRNEGVRLMAERIALTQESEIAMMRTWLTRRGESTEMQGHHGHHMNHQMDPNVPIMPGMLSPVQMDALAASSGAEFDYLYLTGMILHHQGAIDMVNELLSQPGAGEDPELSEFLSAVVADQSTEILRMQNMLARQG
ncbi:DUF305 domain-containing protein [Maricaulis sp.]|uniref:DUF305 domain-containing protein n=1 Tax=Maricaulis sp. TaxID=1486257 RepID=UPI001B0E54D2|nr:DUF305 domain-containing protein [Maricaulis sp.]MBO6795986.1 DUF305 domain-containing protein [Maricaulis sp.]